MRGRDPGLEAARGLGYLSSGLVACRPWPAPDLPPLAFAPLSLDLEFVPSLPHYPPASPAGLQATRGSWQDGARCSRDSLLRPRAFDRAAARVAFWGGIWMKLRPPEVLDCKEFSPGQIASVEVKCLTPQKTNTCI